MTRMLSLLCVIAAQFDGYFSPFVPFEYGPCKSNVFPDPAFDPDQWEGHLYVNFQTRSPSNLTCEYVERSVVVENGVKLLGENLLYTLDGQLLNFTGLLAHPVNPKLPGLYKFEYPMSADENATVYVVWIKFDPYRLDIHYVCTNHPYFANNPAYIFIESPQPMLDKATYKEVKVTLQKNGFKLNKIEMIANCQCDKVPGAKTKCPKFGADVWNEYPLS